MRATVFRGPFDVRIEQVRDAVLAGVHPGGTVAIVDLDGVPSGYAAMDQRTALKVMVRL